MNKRICAALSAVVFLCSSLCFTAGAENSGEAATDPLQHRQNQHDQEQNDGDS